MRPGGPAQSSGQSLGNLTPTDPITGMQTSTMNITDSTQRYCHLRVEAGRFESFLRANHGVLQAIVVSSLVFLVNESACQRHVLRRPLVHVILICQTT